MGHYFGIDKWKVIENGFDPCRSRLSESIMSLGNGRMGIRGNFEEDYSGDSLQGTYIAGVYYPDKTRVGWWKNGYPEYFAKVINAVNFIGIRVSMNGENLDLAKVQFSHFNRTLDMKEGTLSRSFTAANSAGRSFRIETRRFLSISDPDTAAISYSITPLDGDGDIVLTPYLDGDVKNEDSNYDEKFWEETGKRHLVNGGSMTMKTKKLDFYISCAMKYSVVQDGIPLEALFLPVTGEKMLGSEIRLSLRRGSTATLYKYIALVSSRYCSLDSLEAAAIEKAEEACALGYKAMLDRHRTLWSRRWSESDIAIEGDNAAQQAIRFNIFQLNQTYTGDDPRLNIGPKGFTGEKYGGSTYWDTEAFCLPFYLSTGRKDISRNLLLYRYKHLDRARENARKLGLEGALYPMVTMNGEECHNEWEITFEEIHRNAAIAYAIFNYVRYTGDYRYLEEYGFEVLAEICRFWTSRVSYNPFKDKYMLLGVTGPNEYENNVNNNWYTNTMASWCLEYTLDTESFVRSANPSTHEELIRKLNLAEEEMHKWRDIVQKMYYPSCDGLDIFLQQDGYMDKEQLTVKDIPVEERPINKHWSWDRILRSPFIKQADVLQGLYFLGDRFDLGAKKRNFDFYEPRTVHESSLSACIYSVIASEIGYTDKAYELYLRTARLDLDNYNHDTEDGLHITSMGGAWLSIVQGFGGMRVEEDTLSFKPFMPKAWNSYSFKIVFRGHLLSIRMDKTRVLIRQGMGEALKVRVWEREYTIPENGCIEVTGAR
jgi:maltose phosphorylase